VSEWAFLRAGLLAVAALVVAALGGWGAYTVMHQDPGFQQMSKCLVNEKGARLETLRDPIASSAELGALRTVVETNGVTASVAGDESQARRIAADYRSVAGDLGERLELRRRTVYLWDRPPSPTQRQTMFDCTY
jgi:cell wall-associated NlpC family hydrolase